jgi:proliferating cell nuclear antigen
MFEARLPQGSLLKKILDAIKDLVTDANWDCTGFEAVFQGAHNLVLESSFRPWIPPTSPSSPSFSKLMDLTPTDVTAILALASTWAGFPFYYLSLNHSMNKILKCASNDDCITIRAQDKPECVSFVFESPSLFRLRPRCSQ